MSRVRVHNFSISLDGSPPARGSPSRRRSATPATAPRVDDGHPLRPRGLGGSGGTEGVDRRMAERHGPGIGAEIMGANKFGPPGWQDDPEWRGWWGDDPPFHTPTYVLTHRPRPPLEMAGGTTFHFLDAAPAEALAVAREAAARPGRPHRRWPDRRARFLAAGLVDHLHVVQVPILLGRGVRLWDGLEGLSSGTTSRWSRRPAASPTSRSPADVAPVRPRASGGGSGGGSRNMTAWP